MISPRKARNIFKHYFENTSREDLIRDAMKSAPELFDDSVDTPEGEWLIKVWGRGHGSPDRPRALLVRETDFTKPDRIEQFGVAFEQVRNAVASQGHSIVEPPSITDPSGISYVPFHSLLQQRSSLAAIDLIVIVSAIDRKDSHFLQLLSMHGEIPSIWIGPGAESFSGSDIAIKPAVHVMRWGVESIRQELPLVCAAVRPYAEMRYRIWSRKVSRRLQQTFVHRAESVMSARIDQVSREWVKQQAMSASFIHEVDTPELLRLARLLDLDSERRE